MAQQVPFYITSGLPYSKEITVTLPVGRSWWLVDADIEVLAQIREGPDYNDPLLLDLSNYLTYTFTGVNTVLVTMTLTGIVTRKLLDSGFYDFLMSDPFTDDARVIKFLDGPVYRDAVVTADRIPL